MPELTLAAVEFGGYISVVKLVIFVVFFLAWIALIAWLNNDAKAVATRDSFWTGIVLAAGAVGLLLWLVIPVFVVGLIFFLVAVGATSLSYLMHRDSIVPDFERILTLDHITGLFSNEVKQRESYEDLCFITANNNEIPVPEPRTPEFFGFKAAHDLFRDAIYRRVSDVVLSPTSEKYKVHYVVDGATLNQAPIARSQVENLTVFLKQLANLNLEEKRKPQKGKFRIRQDDISSQWEVVTAGSTAGEQIKIRQVTQGTMATLNEINLLPDQYDQLNSVRDLDRGVFLVTGPRQSGVTTTFYALVRNNDAFLNSVSTLEIRPSAELPNVTQQVYSLSDSGTTSYAKKLMSIIRTSPDALGAVDVNNAETAQNICHAAKAGSTVYATLEADSIAGAIVRWIKLIGDKNLAIHSLIGASSQRLFRGLCPDCKQAYEPNQELLRKFNIKADKSKVFYRAGKVTYDKKGKASPCDKCHEIGYFGRTCVFETVLFNDELRKALMQAKSQQDIATELRRARMRNLQEQMMQKVLDGTTAINEMIRIFSGQKATRKPAD